MNECMENGHTLQVKFDALTITRTYVSVNDTVYRTATKWTKSIYILAADLMLDGQSLDRKKRGTRLLLAHIHVDFQ